MPPPNTAAAATSQKKYDHVSPAPDRSELPTVLFGPFAAAFSLPSEKDIESLPVIETGPTLEEQQRRFQTASVIRDWEISAWYSIAGREVGPSSHLPVSVHLSILVSFLFPLLLSVQHHIQDLDSRQSKIHICSLMYF